MIRSKDLFTELFSALQLPELINSQMIHHSVYDSALRFMFTYWGMVCPHTILHIIRWRRHTALSGIHALKLLHCESVLCAQWHSDSYVCSRFANHEPITTQTWTTSLQFSVRRRVSPHPHAGCIVRWRFTRLSSTELWEEWISSWTDSVQFIHSKYLFVRTTRSWPTQH